MPDATVFHAAPSKRRMSSVPVTRIPARASSPFEVMDAPLVVAWLVMSTLLTETATPTPTVPASVALPSASAIASVLAKLRRDTLPTAVTVVALANEAVERLATMLIATAPATVTVFSPVP